MQPLQVSPQIISPHLLHVRPASFCGAVSLRHSWQPMSPGRKLLLTAGEIEAQGGRLLWLKSPRSPTPTPKPFQLPRHHTAHSSFYLNSKYGAGREGCGAPRGQQSNRLPPEASLSFLVRGRTARGGKSNMLTPSWTCSLGKTAEPVGVWATGHLADWPSLMWGSWDQRILGYQMRWPRRGELH